jgi:hypothetical protein
MLATAAAPDMDPYAYLERVTNVIPGWLESYAAIRTMDLLEWQEAQGVRGPLFEIGVFAGKYLSLLIRSALRTGDRIIGLDTFQWVTEPAVREHLGSTPGSERVELIAGMTTNFSATDLMDRLGKRPRFVSIDGSHTCDDVFWDMTLAEQILAPDGIVAADDFLNPLTLGVGEAIHKFFAMPRNLAPFAYTANKLFLCRSPMSDIYREAFERFVVEDQREPQSANFRERLTHGRNHVEQPLWGRRVLVP